MRHAFPDRYSELDSPLHRRDPRIKILAAFGFVVSAVFVPPGAWALFAGHLLLALALLAASRVPAMYAFKRSLVIVPFVLVVCLFLPFVPDGEPWVEFELAGVNGAVYREGLRTAYAMLARGYLAALALLLLAATTPFPALLKGLESMGTPVIFVVLLSFMYRYLFLLVDEAEKMETARRSRYFGGAFFRQLRVLAGMLALLFVRTYERGELIYESMRARGFDGRVRVLKPLRVGAWDLFAVLAFGAALGGLRWLA